MNRLTVYYGDVWASSHDGTPHPEWAAELLALLSELDNRGMKDQRLTPGELDLLDGIVMRLRHRLGEKGGRDQNLDLGSLGNYMIRTGIELITAEPADPGAG